VWTAALVVVLVGGVFGLRWWRYSQTHVSTDDAQVASDIYSISPRIAGHILTVGVDEGTPVRRGQVLAVIDPRDYQVALDQAQAAYEQAVSGAQAAGGTVTVTERTGGAGISQAAAGVSAAQGGVAAAQAAQAAAEAQVTASERAAQAATASREMAEREVGATQAAVTAARAQAQQAEKDAERNRALIAKGAISRQQADQTDAAATTAQANLEAAQARLSSAQSAVAQGQARERQAQAAVAQAQAAVGQAKAGVGQAQAGVGQAQAAEQSAQVSPEKVAVSRSEAKSAGANVAAARAKLEQARLNLAYTKILAPVDGIVAQKNVERGQYVQAGQPLFAVVPAGGAYVTANFKETQLAKMRPDQPATFTVDAYPGVTFRGHVEFLSPGTGSVFSLLPPENATGNFTKVVQRIPVRIVIDRGSAQYPLRAGMNVIATVDVGQSK